ncbi:hypothetical protein BLTE_10740 [Blastochloris tepida]|uniref:Uncharacterized protein n=2 Tax=Blastochloris tepida TaxID=2233851 RepID=A0A348FYK6_9HYPH|nr:hypothetical protein BLTE_10740 [Blastochloris tepida]
MPLQHKPPPPRLPCDAPLQLWMVMSALRRTRQQIEVAKAALVEIAAMWAEVAPSCGDTIDTLMSEMEELHRDINEAVGERVAAGEENGL